MMISVIVPVYNSEKFLKECLNSIIGQTYRDLEIILIDDGSTDNSGLICDEYAQVDARIKVIHKRNEGVSKARNAGFEASNGEVISFVDSDDTLDLDMYDFLIALMKEHQADIVHCGYKHIVGNEVRQVSGSQRIIVQNANEALTCLLSGKWFSGGLWNKIYKREILTELKFDGELKNSEDILYNYHAFSRANKTVFADYTKYNYYARVGESACFTMDDDKKKKDSLKVDHQIFLQLSDSPLMVCAAERYLRTLTDCYRSFHDEKAYADEMWAVFKKVRVQDRKIRLSVYAIHYLPKLYSLIYQGYGRIRKPNWEVRT